MAGAIGLDHAYPKLGLFGLLNAGGQAFAAESETGCASFVFDAPFTNFNKWTTVPDGFELPRV
jgi:hypothetical protein